MEEGSVVKVRVAAVTYIGRGEFSVVVDSDSATNTTDDEMEFEPKIKATPCVLSSRPNFLGQGTVAFKRKQFELVFRE